MLVQTMKSVDYVLEVRTHSANWPHPESCRMKGTAICVIAVRQDFNVGQIYAKLYTVYLQRFCSTTCPADCSLYCQIT